MYKLPEENITKKIPVEQTFLNKLYEIAPINSFTL